jgi:Icc protein
MARIIQLTDIHIPTDEELEAHKKRGIDPKKNFLGLIDMINPKADDLLVITGDIAAFSPNKHIYDWVQAELEKLPCESRVICGNHDDYRVLPEYFDEKYLPNKRYFGQESWNDWDLIYLDTSHAQLDENQKKWLGDIQLKNTKSIIFMHHPPIRIGSMWMEHRYPLNDMQEHWELIKNVPNLKAVICGHYHNDEVKTMDGIEVMLTPSTIYQISDDPKDPESRIDSLDAGYRVLELSDASISTYTDYLA